MRKLKGWIKQGFVVNAGCVSRGRALAGQQQCFHQELLPLIPLELSFCPNLHNMTINSP